MVYAIGLKCKDEAVVSLEVSDCSVLSRIHVFRLDVSTPVGNSDAGENVFSRGIRYEFG